jgi:hypothetical protein
MHKFSTAALQSLALTVLRDPQQRVPLGLLDVLESTPAVPSRRAPCQAGAFFASLRLRRRRFVTRTYA